MGRFLFLLFFFSIASLQHLLFLHVQSEAVGSSITPINYDLYHTRYFTPFSIIWRDIVLLLIEFNTDY